MSFPCLFKAVFTDTISWSSTPVTSHWFQFNPWLTFKNTVPFQPYLSFIPSSAPHIKQSDLLSLWFKNQKNTFECLTLYPWAHCLHPILFLPSQYMYLQNKLSLFLRTHFTVTFFLKHLLVTPLLSLCLFTTSVPLYYNCSVLQLLDLIVLRDS